MNRSPTLAILGLTAAALLVNYLVLSTLASTQASIASHWTSGAGVLVIGATLLGYWWADGRDPIPTASRIGYSLLAAVMNAASGYLNFLAMARAWRNASLPAEHQDFLYQLLHPGVLGDLVERSGHGPALDSGWGQAVAVGFFAGGLVTFYGFKYFAENAGEDTAPEQ